VPHFALPDGFDPLRQVEMRYVEHGPSSKTTEHATGTGAGLTTTSDEAASKFVTSAPGSTLPGIGSTGGSLSSTLSVRNLRDAAGNPLLWVGIVSILAAGVAFYFGLRRAAIVCVAIGIGFLAASMIPGWGWFILAAVGLVAVGVYVWAELTGKNTREALRAVVAGVEDLPTEQRRQAKARIASHADDRDALTIRAIKRADGLPSERPEP
jgi:hypothetical protein